MNLSDLLQTRLTDASNVPPIETTITVKDGIFAIKGDISFVSGMAKSGKSTICRYIIATALMETIPDDFDSLSIRSIYCEGRPVVYIDTEQPKAFTMKAKDEIKRLLRTETLPENLHIFNWRHQTYKENREAIQLLFDHFTDSALWVVDGITDFLSTANDEEKSNELINFFMRYSTSLNTTIVLLIHEIQNTGKLRGHLGSEAERKCGGAISIRKDRETKTHWIQPKLIRGSGDFDSHAFQYDEDQKGFVSLSDAKSKELRTQLDKQESRLAELHRLAQAIYGEEIRITRTELKKGLRQHISRKPGQGDEAYDKVIQRTIKDMLDNYNIITNLGEPKDSFKYLCEVEPAPSMLSLFLNGK
ncbi:hypothetical protein G8759_10305 [Spirosoma aureum]|uniref:AAA family ATPase n=1 Tax=Spirosoma aureum TaxID=2692134 RepID=A0A6G9AKY1_9BACT|nr:hypothetical protein [Spirosoma aureum]QIP12989.1 hypothetical protein G8759_10305 [Spirosoma aureum]